MEEDVENDIFKKLKAAQDSREIDGLPRVIDYGTKNNGDKYFVMQRLGIRLVDVMKRNKLRFSY